MAIDYGNLLTLPQQKAITILPMISGAMSIVGSTVIVYMILSDRKKKLSKVKHRLLLSMSIVDVIYSFWFAIWGPTIPAGTPGVWGAMGNRATCSAQGFFIQFGIAVPMYNAALCVYYYLVVTKSMSNDAIAKRFEPAMHAVSLLYPFLTGVAAFGIQGGLYNYDSLGCWIAPYPRGCKHDDTVPCTRGQNAYLFQWLFAGFQEASACIVIVVTMFLVYREVHSAELIMRTRYSFRSGSVSDSRSMSEKKRKTLNQALSYVAAVVMTRIWSFVVVMVDEFGGTNHFAILVLEQFFFPLQGFWNSMIYIKPFFDDTRQESPDKSFWWVLAKAIVDPPTEERRRSSRRSSTSRTRESKRSRGNSSAFFKRFSRSSNDSSARRGSDSSAGSRRRSSSMSQFDSIERNSKSNRRCSSSCSWNRRPSNDSDIRRSSLDLNEGGAVEERGNGTASIVRKHDSELQEEDDPVESRNFETKSKESPRKRVSFDLDEGFDLEAGEFFETNLTCDRVHGARIEVGSENIDTDGSNMEHTTPEEKTMTLKIEKQCQNESVLELQGSDDADEGMGSNQEQATLGESLVDELKDHRNQQIHVFQGSLGSSKETASNWEQATSDVDDNPYTSLPLQCAEERVKYKLPPESGLPTESGDKSKESQDEDVPVNLAQ